MSLRPLITVAAVLTVPVSPALGEPYHAPSMLGGADAPPGHHHAHYPDLRRASGGERRRGRALLAAVRRVAGTRFPTVSAAERLGYRKGPPSAYIGMEQQRAGVRSPFVHYRSARYEADGRVLDPLRPEALVYWEPTGMEAVLVGFMFRASSLSPPPDPHGTGPLLTWHAHTACDPEVERGNPLQFRSDRCPSGLAHHGDTQMTHVWLAKGLRAGFAGAVPAREMGIYVPGIPAVYRGGHRHASASHGHPGGGHDHGARGHRHDHRVALSAAQATVANAWAVSLVAPLGALLLLVRAPRRPAGLPLLGIVCLAGVALAHAVDLGAHVESAPYLGALFCGLIAASSGLAIALAVAWRPRLAWSAAVATSVTAIAGYVVSRTVGLPQIEDHVGEWGEPAALAALACEVGVIALGVTALATRRR